LLCGKPVFDYVMETVASVGFGEVLVVSQHRNHPRVNVVVNDRPEVGQGHALRLGLHAAQSAGWDYICVVLGDMPFVESEHIQKLISIMTENQSVISHVNGQKMPPAVFSPSAIAKILSSDVQGGARAIFDELNLLSVPIAAEQALDVDTQEDLIRLDGIMKARIK